MYFEWTPFTANITLHQRKRNFKKTGGEKNVRHQKDNKGLSYLPCMQLTKVASYAPHMVPNQQWSLSYTGCALQHPNSGPKVKSSGQALGRTVWKSHWQPKFEWQAELRVRDTE